MKIIIDKDIPFIKDRFPADVEVKYLAGKEFTQEEVKNADAIIVRTRTKCDEKLLTDSDVKLVVTATIGTDHIDLSWCEANDITVKNAPGCNAPGVAQYVFTSLFKTGFKAECHTLGIVGYGHVGQMVGEWAKQLGIKVMVCDPPRKEAGFIDVEYQDLTSILQNSDAVTLHVPFTKEGKHPTCFMIGSSELALIKPGALLINSSRGGVVDEKALKQKLKEGSIRAVIDTWENEPEIDSELMSLVHIGTPHIAGYSAEGKIRATKMALEAVEEFFKIAVDKTGLCCVPCRDTITADLIEKSYNPLEDYKKLKNNITAFENIRNNYNYRHEPLFINS